MKFTFLLVVLLLSLFQFAHGQTNESDQTRLRGFAMTQTFQYDGREYEYHLTTDNIKDTPSWNPSNSDPPLTMQNAIKIALDNLKRFVKTPKNWKVKSIKLDELDNQKWIYDISFQLKSEFIRNADISFNILVKMDGSIVEPEITTKEK